MKYNLKFLCGLSGRSTINLSTEVEINLTLSAAVDLPL